MEANFVTKANLSVEMKPFNKDKNFQPCPCPDKGGFVFVHMSLCVSLCVILSEES